MQHDDFDPNSRSPVEMLSKSWRYLFVAVFVMLAIAVRSDW